MKREKPKRKNFTFREVQELHKRDTFEEETRKQLFALLSCELHDSRSVSIFKGTILSLEKELIKNSEKNLFFREKNLLFSDKYLH